MVFLLCFVEGIKLGVMCIYGEFSSGGMGINMVRVESKLLILKRIELEVLKNEVEDYFLLLVLVL